MEKPVNEVTETPTQKRGKIINFLIAMMATGVITFAYRRNTRRINE